MNSLMHFLGPHSMVGQYGYFGLFAVLFLECLGLPVPGETTLILASGLTADGTFNSWLVWAVASAAAISGDNLGYLIGLKGGRPMVLAYGAKVGLTDRRFNLAEKLMQRRGWLIVAGARFFPFLREVNGLAAGTTQMHWRTFFLANAAGGIVWAGMWTFFGGFVARHLSYLLQLMKQIGPGIVPILAVGAVAAFLGLRSWMRRLDRGD